MATVLFYLSDVEEGGETVFLLEGEAGVARKPSIDYKSCDVGYKARGLCPGSLSSAGLARRCARARARVWERLPGRGRTEPGQRGAAKPRAWPRVAGARLFADRAFLHILAWACPWRQPTVRTGCPLPVRRALPLT